jgi:hypothetical protein
MPDDPSASAQRRQTLAATRGNPPAAQQVDPRDIKESAMADPKDDRPDTPPNQNNITQDGDPAGKADPATRPTTDQLRDDIDSGRTGDKVGYTDPASAPLGTDAEAGGFRPPPGEVSQARATETARPDAPKADTGRPVTSERAPATDKAGGNKMIWWIVGAIVVILLLILLF